MTWTCPKADPDSACRKTCCKNYKSFGQAFTKACRGHGDSVTVSRSAEREISFCLNKRRRGEKTVLCDCFFVGNPRMGFPIVFFDKKLLFRQFARTCPKAGPRLFFSRLLLRRRLPVYVKLKHYVLSQIKNVYTFYGTRFVAFAAADTF